MWGRLGQTDANKRPRESQVTMMERFIAHPEQEKDERVEPGLKRKRDGHTDREGEIRESSGNQFNVLLRFSMSSAAQLSDCQVLKLQRRCIQILGVKPRRDVASSFPASVRSVVFRYRLDIPRRSFSHVHKYGCTDHLVSINRTSDIMTQQARP